MGSSENRFLSELRIRHYSVTLIYLETAYFTSERSTYEQAQTPTETTIFILVFCYNDQFSFNLKTRFLTVN